MKLTQISRNAHQLTRYGFVNCYLIREADGFTLVDTALAGCANDILAAATSLGAPIRRILLTHAHVDHVGSVDEIATKLPSVTVSINERSLPLLRRPADKSLRPDEPQESFGGGLPGIKTPITQLVAEQELFGSLRVIDTPGHIPGHLSFLDERDGTLYAGDALITVGRLSVCGWTRWYFPLPSFVLWSKSLCLTSARKLLTYPIQRFACGHGMVRDGGIPALNRAIASAEVNAPR